MKNKDMDKLKELEKESQELLTSIKSMADKENLEMSLPSLDITENEPQFLRRRIPSWVAVAAMLTGIVIGFAMDLFGVQLFQQIDDLKAGLKMAAHAHETGVE